MTAAELEIAIHQHGKLAVPISKHHDGSHTLAISLLYSFLVISRASETFRSLPKPTYEAYATAGITPPSTMLCRSALAAYEIKRKGIHSQYSVAASV
jgi:hypothetical protein